MGIEEKIMEGLLLQLIPNFFIKRKKEKSLPAVSYVRPTEPLTLL